MFSNNTVSILQKTYDESYMTCSKAVYYEGQGNEDEAMRCWKLALEQIYDHHANRLLPTFVPRTETEKALVESLRQLELQCKERIDLLEALRLSRQEASQNGTPFSVSGSVSGYGYGSGSGSGTGSRPSKSSSDSNNDSVQQGKGWIGGGTIPAVTYPELLRTGVTRRPSVSPRTLSDQAATVEPRADRSSFEEAAVSPSGRPLPPVPTQSPARKSPRVPSPERHTMRTTLRSGRSGEKTPRATLRRQTSKQAEGPGASKAATLAWGATNQRDTTDRGTPSPQVLSRTLSNTTSPLFEQSRKSLESLHKRWDSNSRRLVLPRSQSPAKRDKRTSLELADPRFHDDPSYTRPSPISISAASSALNSLALRDSAEKTSPEKDTLARHRTAPPQTPRTRVSREPTDVDSGLSEGMADRLRDRQVLSDSAAARAAARSRLSATKSKATPTRSGKSSRTPRSETHRTETKPERSSSPHDSDSSSSSLSTTTAITRRKKAGVQKEASLVTESLTVSSESSTDDEHGKSAVSWKKRKADILKKLPPGVDEHAAKQILNEIVVQGDQVHWGDIAGLEVAKNALRETVVYPFLRPDLFMGLREPARGMLLFGPPGTGKTMLARAVATESKSTFFSISASSLTSKYLGESEKLVRALFALAKSLAPSIIFVDEIDSLLSQRSGSSEHEATRRIKTEFLIQWSDLQRAAAGREVGERDKERGDANRVLVLAATNLPWAIDEAARRRFVRRQYIPLPEAETRGVQLQTLLKQQKHTLSDADIETLVGLTDGFSGSDITALAKDAAMGPLRSLGEALLHMTMEEIRPIELTDFIASLATIRPSVSRAGLKQYEDWAREFGERGG